MKWNLFFLCLFSLAVPISGWADESPPVLILTEEGKYYLSLYLEILEDPANILTIKDILSPDYNNKFSNYRGKHPNLGLEDSPVWARFTISNPGEDRELYISYNYALADYVDYYEIYSDGSVRHLAATEGGKSIDVSFPYRRIVFDTSIPAGETREYYIRVYSPRTAMTIIMTLWDLKSFMNYERNALLFFGIVFGAAICIAGYFFGTSFKLKEPTQFWFSLYLVLLAIHALLRGGVIQNILPPLSPNWFNAIHLISIGGSSFCGIRLFRLFLDVGKRSKHLDRFLKVMEWASIAFIPLSYGPILSAAGLGLLVYGVTPILTTGAAFYFWYKGVPTAKYFALGWLATNAASVIEFLRIIGLLPWELWMYGAFSTGVIWSIAFYTAAISNRVYHFKYFSQQDSLTGLSNRHALQGFLNKEWQRNLRAERPLSILMIDVDRFKAFNDSQGHQKGDECLIKIVEVLKSHATRPGDLAGRYGGEEFIIILSETESFGALKVAEKIRSGVENLNIPRKDDYGPAVTVSVGTATEIPTHETTTAWLIDLADRAMYEAKNTGRNKVCTPPVYNSLPPESCN